jgi:hypothetical protein
MLNFTIGVRGETEKGRGKREQRCINKEENEKFLRKKRKKLNKSFLLLTLKLHYLMRRI